jgi:hypothetical protein
VEGHIPKKIFFSDFFIPSSLNETKLSLQCCINNRGILTQFTQSPTCPANFTFLKYPFNYTLLRAIKYTCSYLGGGWDLVLWLKTPYYARNACLVPHNQVRTLHFPSLRYSLICD